MIRKYTPYYRWNAFDDDDIKDIDGVIEFARGLVIKDSDYADSLETETSLKASDLYMRANDNTLDPSYSEFQRQLIVKQYKESNPYYQNLYAKYGIKFYDARKAKDKHILKSINNTLDKYHKGLFEKAYYEALNYYHQVIYTHAFDNQHYQKQFYAEYLIFMTIQRYINMEMNAYFNVDTYTQRQLKNGFISNGLDYFDSFPTEYQRRIYKVLNDLIRNKGSNNVFDIIKDIFSFNNLTINRYLLGKTKSPDGGDDLTFYKTNIDEKLNIDTDPQVGYEYLVNQDPYWRVPKEKVIEQDFNVLNTKYISTDIMLDILTDSRQMSYFYGLLNRLQIKQNKLIDKYMKDHRVSYEEARTASGAEDVDFWFSDRNISDRPINIFDAIVTLLVLIFDRMRWPKKIHHKNGAVKNTYGFNFDADVKEDLFKIRKYLLWNQDKMDTDMYTRLTDFFQRFHLQDFDKDEKTDKMEYIMEKYNSSAVYYNQLYAYSQYLQGKYNGSHKVQDELEAGNIYNALEYINNLLLDTRRKAPLESIADFKYLKDLLSDYITFQVDNGNTTQDEILRWLNSAQGAYIIDELDKFVTKLKDYKLTKLYNHYTKNMSNKNLLAVLIEINDAIARVTEDKRYTGSVMLLRYRNLSTFLDLYLSFINRGKTKFSIEEFSNIYRYDQGLENELRQLDQETDDYTIHAALVDIWNKKFVADFPMDTFVGYATYTDYLKDKDPNLYYYTIVDINYSNIDNFDYEGAVRDKIFELTTAIDNHLELDEYNFFLENNFIGLEEYVKRYVYILTQVFKAYTIQTAFAHTVYTLNSPWDNGFKVMDKLITRKSKLLLRDFLEVQDEVAWHGSIQFADRVDNTFRIYDQVKITVKENGEAAGDPAVYTDNIEAANPVYKIPVPNSVTELQ